MMQKEIAALYAETAKYTTEAAYIAAQANTGAFASEGEATNVYRNLWAIHTDGFKAIVKATGVSARQIAIRYGIPQRTIESWGMRDREAPPYVYLLIAHDMGII